MAGIPEQMKTGNSSNGIAVWKQMNIGCFVYGYPVKMHV